MLFRPYSRVCDSSKILLQVLRVQLTACELQESSLEDLAKKAWASFRMIFTFSPQSFCYFFAFQGLKGWIWVRKIAFREVSATAGVAPELLVEPLRELRMAHGLRAPAPGAREA